MNNIKPLQVFNKKQMLEFKNIKINDKQLKCLHSCIKLFGTNDYNQAVIYNNGLSD
jgi:hypothetical protein